MRQLTQSKMKTAVSSLALFLIFTSLGACKRPPGNEPPDGHAASASVSEQQGLKLSIPVPVSSGTWDRQISLGSPGRPLFHVLLTNDSPKAINVWRDWC